MSAVIQSFNDFVRTYNWIHLFQLFQHEGRDYPSENLSPAACECLGPAIWDVEKKPLECSIVGARYIAIFFKWLWHRNLQSASFSTYSNLSAQVHEMVPSIQRSQTCQRLLLWCTLILQILRKTIVRQFRGLSYLISWVCRKQVVVKQVYFPMAALWNAVNEYICRADS